MNNFVLKHFNAAIGNKSHLLAFRWARLKFSLRQRFLGGSFDENQRADNRSDASLNGACDIRRKCRINLSAREWPVWWRPNDIGAYTRHRNLAYLFHARTWSAYRGHFFELRFRSAVIIASRRLTQIRTLPRISRCFEAARASLMGFQRGCTDPYAISGQ